MAKIMYKTFRAEVKNVDVETGTIDMLIPMSTGAIDRDNEVIRPSAWKHTLVEFKKRPVLLSSHSYQDLRKQIGEFVELKISDAGLLAKPRYYINEGNDEVDWAFKLASKGRAAFSVGFIPNKWDDGDGEKEPGRTYTEVELLEISQVVVPSNRDAIQAMVAKGISDSIVQDIATEVLAETSTTDGNVDYDTITKPEETDDYIRIPVAECQITATIDISKKEGIKALYCGKDKKVATYLFDKRDPYNWTMEKAKKWVEDHKSAKPAEVSQMSIADELDYVKSLIEKEGLNEEAEVVAWDVVREIMGFRGDHIPLDILAKAGAVLSAKNRGALKEAQALIQSVLDSAESSHEEPKEVDPTTIGDLIGETMKRKLAEMQGKIQ